MAYDPIRMDIAYLSQQLDAMKAAFPEVFEDEDEAFRADVLEGETTFNEVMSRILDHKLEADEMVSAIKEREGNLAERRGRYQRKSDGLKSLMLSLMEKANQRVVSLPEATVSINKPRESVVIINVDDLPQGTFSIVRQPDKTAIKTTLQAGGNVPGARLEMGQSSLSVRLK